MRDVGGHQRFVERRRAHHDVVNAGAVFVAPDAETSSCIGLRIAIDEQSWQAFEGEASSQVDGGGRFADATLLINDGEDFGRCGAGCWGGRFHGGRFGRHDGSWKPTGSRRCLQWRRAVQKHAHLWRKLWMTGILGGSRGV